MQIGYGMASRGIIEETAKAPLPKKRRATKRRGPHPDKALTAAFCRNVGESGRYADGNGLYLHVDPSGARRWVQRLVIRGKSCVLGLGSFTLVPLAEARERALANRELARSGGDPLRDRRRTAGVPTFTEATEQVIAVHREAWKDGEATAQEWRATLQQYVHQHFGDKGVDRVTTADVMAALLPIWSAKNETAQRVRRRIGAIMRWAIAQGYRSDNPGGDAVTAALPKRPRQIRHMPALAHGEVGAALAGVRVSQAWTGTKLAFELLVLTAARSGEVRLATWEEFDLAALVWTVPAARMKANREHRVPLCGRAVEVLREAERLRDVVASVEPAGLVFPSRRGKALGDMAFLKLVKRQGMAAVPHGFRSSFRDWAAEKTDHPREVIEAALAHVVGNRTEAAYARSDLFERRRLLMDDWAAYLVATRRPR